MSTLRLGTLNLHLAPDPAALLGLARTCVSGLDTADVYGARPGETEAALPRDLPVTTKVGLVRDGARWTPRGTAKHLRDALARCVDRGPVDAVLLHAIDPDVGLATSWRTLLKAREDGLVAAVGLCNVRAHELREALALGRPDVVQVELSVFAPAALRTGLVRICAEHGIALQAHSPLGGHRRKGRVHPALRPIAAAHGISAERLALAWLASISAEPVIGCTRAETLADATGPVPADALTAARDAFPLTARARQAPRPTGERQITLILGLAGAGKTTLAQRWTDAGAQRFNRDELGGTLTGLVARMDEALSAGAQQLVADNTWLERDIRGQVVELGERHGARVHAVWVTTPLVRCQAHVVARILQHTGDLPEPDALARSKQPWLFGPRVLYQQVERFEPPTEDEGFSLERVDPPPRPPGLRAGTIVGLAALEAHEQLPRPLYVAAWVPDPERQARLVAAVAKHRPEDVVTCAHPPGPPICWCRPPLPGLGELLRGRHALDPARTTVIGGPAERGLAEACGFVFQPL